MFDFDGWEERCVKAFSSRLRNNQKKEKKMTTDKHFCVAEKGSWNYETYATYEEAEVSAKHKANNQREDIFIYTPIAVARCPVPEIAVEKLS